MTDLPIYYPQVLVRVTAIVQTNPQTDPIEVSFVTGARSVKIERNDWNTADKCTVVLDLQRFPVLPRSIRQAHITVYAGDNLAIGTDGDVISDASYIRFCGYVDEPKIDLDEGDHKVTWEARDYTALFLDEKLPSTSVVPRYSDTLDQALQRILTIIPGGENIQLVLGGGLTQWPSLSTAVTATLRDTKVPIAQNDTAWHFVKRACDPVSLIPQIRLDTLVVAPSKGLAAPKSQAVLVYGANLASYSEKKVLPKNHEAIGLRAYNLNSRSIITSIYPPLGDARVTKPVRPHAGKKGGKPKMLTLKFFNNGKNIRWYPYPDVQSQAALDAATQRIYGERRQAEYEGSFRVARMRVPDWNVDDSIDGTSFDVTQIASGDRVRVLPLAQQRAVLDSMQSTDQRVSYLVSQGFDSDVAAALVRVHEEQGNAIVELFVRKATHEYDESQGFSLVVDFQNIIATTI